MVMQSVEATPRVTGHMLAQHMGRMVFLVCDTSSFGNDNRGNFLVKTTDGVEIAAAIPAGEQFERLVSALHCLCQNSILIFSCVR
jgi:hypothetical protein